MAPIPLLGLTSGDAIAIYVGPQIGVTYAGTRTPTITISLLGSGAVRIETNNTIMIDGTAEVPNPNSWNPLRVVKIPGTTVVNLNPVVGSNWIRVVVDTAGAGTCETGVAWQIPGEVVDPLIYTGEWNADTNVPEILDGVGLRGQYYLVVVPGLTVIDSIDSWDFGDIIAFTGERWTKITHD